MRIPHGRHLAGACLVTVASLALTPLPARAGETSPSGQHCQTILGVPDPVTRLAEVESFECAPNGEQLVAPEGRTLLIRWYRHAYYYEEGWWDHTDIYGSAGPCDSAGYGIRETAYWNSWGNEISGFKVFNNCNWTKVWPQTNFRGGGYGYYGNVPYVGDKFNDRIRSMWLSA